VIANQPFAFSANIVPSGSSRNAFSTEDIKAMEDQMIWTSSVDGEIAVGNNQYVSGLSAGEHQLTVSIGQPGDQVYGDGTSNFTVIDQIISNEASDFHPIPCVRSISKNNSPCLLTSKFNLYRYKCIDNSYDHGDIFALNRGNNLTMIRL